MKKRKTTLPRLTVLAMSRRELVEFVRSVEQLPFVLGELQELVKQFRMVAPAPKRAKTNGVPTPPVAHLESDGK
jgi:hypothetical protein